VPTGHIGSPDNIVPSNNINNI